VPAPQFRRSRRLPARRRGGRTRAPVRTVAARPSASHQPMLSPKVAPWSRPCRLPCQRRRILRPHPVHQMQLCNQSYRSAHAHGESEPRRSAIRRRASHRRRSMQRRAEISRPRRDGPARRCPHSAMSDAVLLVFLTEQIEAFKCDSVRNNKQICVAVYRGVARETPVWDGEHVVL